jgi:hypothetical protein
MKVGELTEVKECDEMECQKLDENTMLTKRLELTTGMGRKGTKVSVKAGTYRVRFL